MTAKHGMLVMTDEVMESWYRVSILIMTALVEFNIDHSTTTAAPRQDRFVCHDDLSFIVSIGSEIPKSAFLGQYIFTVSTPVVWSSRLMELAYGCCTFYLYLAYIRAYL
jgi:hypothetical protein